jgi:competence protein ComEA
LVVLFPKEVCMEHGERWWQRRTTIAALVCAFAGLGILFFGPTLRSVAGFTPRPTAAQKPVSALLSPVDEVPTAEPERTAIELPAQPAIAIVYISGAVMYPDVYRLPGDARVKDVVMAAGGLSPDAAGEQINLAAPISDAQHIHVPRRGEQPVAVAGTSGSAASSAATTGGLLNLNSASQAELEDLPGIGATLAERIIAYREANGPFTSVEDLRKVSGVGAKLFERLAPLVTTD